MTTKRDPETGLCLRGATNRNARGGAEERRRRRQYLVTTYRADVDAVTRPLDQVHNNDPIEEVIGQVPLGEGVPACRCYRCGDLLTENTVSADKIVPACKKTAKYPNGGTYVRENIRPACLPCQSKTGGDLAAQKRTKRQRTRLTVVRV